MLVFDKTKRTNALDVLKFFIKFKESENSMRPMKRKKEAQNEREKSDLGNKSAQVNDK